MVAKTLQRPALVLNRNWQPVNVATVARALVLLWNESARVVDPTDYQLYTWENWPKLRPRDDERFIQAVKFRLRVPEVITLSDYDRLPSAAVAFSRRNIFKRDHYRLCERLDIEYSIGLGMNPVLKRNSEELLEKAVQQCEQTGEPQRLFTGFDYQAGTWEQSRWVVLKCEANFHGTN